MDAPPNVMNGPEAAAYLHVRPSTLRALVREDRIPYTRLGDRIVVFVREVLDLWLIMGTRGANAASLKELAIHLRQPSRAPTGVPLSRTEEDMLAASRKDLAKGRSVPLLRR